jgi:hypothetical protein
MAELSKKMEAFPVRFRASEQSGQPLFSDHSHVGVANRMAYLDFSFIESASLASAIRRTTDGNGAAKRLEGTALSRVARGTEDL